MVNKLKEIENCLFEALRKIERNWILNPNGDFKHIRRDLIDALNGFGNELHYGFDPENPGSEHTAFMVYQRQCGNI